MIANHNERSMKEGKCDVCGHSVMVDMIGNGDTCKTCGWRQDAAAKELPDQILLANKVSLEKARRLYREGKPIRPDFNDFCDFCDLYKEVEFVYDHHSYAVAKNRHGGIVLIDCENQMQLGEFANLEVFMVKAQVNGVLIRELWPKIENFEWVD